MQTSPQMILHKVNDHAITEVTGEEVFILDASSGLQILMDAAAQGDGKVILHQKNITPAFFDLKTKLAGDILQKAVNYGVQLAIVGDFENITSQSLKAFIVESNRGQQYRFVKDLQSALEFLC